MPSPTLPEGTDHIIDGNGEDEAGTAPAFAPDARIGEETMFTPDEEPAEERAAPGNGGEAGPTASPGAGGGGAETARKPGEAGTTNVFASFDAWRTGGADQVRDYAQAGLDRANGAIEEVVRLINDAADQIDSKVGEQYGGYARRAAEGVGSFGDALKGKDVDQLFEDAREVVRKSPAVAIGAAAALGFVVARLARAGFEAAEAATKPKTAA